MQLNGTLEEENRALMDQLNKLLAQVFYTLMHLILLLIVWFFLFCHTHIGFHVVFGFYRMKAW